jgi:hypothetical protein
MAGPVCVMSAENRALILIQFGHGLKHGVGPLIKG